MQKPRFHLLIYFFIFSEKGGIIMEADKHLDNSINAALPNVRRSAPCTPQVTLIFPVSCEPNVKSSVASMLLAVLTKMQGSDKK